MKIAIDYPLDAHGHDTAVQLPRLVEHFRPLFDLTQATAAIITGPCGRKVVLQVGGRKYAEVEATEVEISWAMSAGFPTINTTVRWVEDPEQVASYHSRLADGPTCDLENLSRGEPLMARVTTHRCPRCGGPLTLGATPAGSMGEVWCSATPTAKMCLFGIRTVLSVQHFLTDPTNPRHLE